MIQEAPDWALQNVASLTQTAVVGSVATGSHGSSGVDPATGRAILSSNSGYVNSVELVCADGSLRTFRRGDPEFGGVVTACGVSFEGTAEPDGVRLISTRPSVISLIFGSQFSVR